MIYIYERKINKLTTIYQIKKDDNILAKFDSDKGRINLGVLKDYIGEDITRIVNDKPLDNIYTIKQLKSTVEGDDPFNNASYGLSTYTVHLDKKEK